MNRLKKIALVLAAFVAALVLVVLLVFGLHGRSREVRLSDGTVLRLEKVNFGKRDPLFKPGGWWQRAKEKVAPHLPKKFADKLVKPLRNSSSSWSGGVAFLPRTNEPSLNVWLTRIDPKTGDYQSVGVWSAVLLDKDGCEFGHNVAGGEDKGLLAPLPAPAGGGLGSGTFGGGFGSGGFGSSGGSGGMTTGVSGPRSSVTWFSFEVFPRREKEFKLRVYDMGAKLVAEFTVVNPAPIPPGPSSPATSLPVSVTNGNVVFRLASAVISTNLSRRGPSGIPPTVIFSFENLEGGQPSTNWDAVALELKDRPGNWAPKTANYPYALCPDEPAWRLQAKFSGRQDPTNATFTVRGLAVPGPAAVIQLGTNVSVDGNSITLLGLSGPNTTTIYSNEVLFAEPLQTTGRGGGRGVSSALRGRYASVGSLKPHLTLKLGGIGEDQALSVTVTDDQGRQYSAWEAQNTASSFVVTSANLSGSRDYQYVGREPRVRGGRGGAPPADIRFLNINLPPDSTLVDVTFHVHRTRAVEFIFKPPPAPGKLK